MAERLVEEVIKYITENYQSDKYIVQSFDSGCAMIDLNHLGKTIVIQAEPNKVGVSVLSTDIEIDFSLPDQVFYSLNDFTNHLNDLGK